jgi:hypothetical protein
MSGLGDQLDQIEGPKAQEAGACARGHVSAIAGALGASSVSEGVDQPRGEIESLSGSCSETLAP